MGIYQVQHSTGPSITIFGSYQVVEVNPHRSGPTMFATQLYSLYTAQGRAQPKQLHRHHAEDLILFIKHCQSQGEWIIVARDFNGVLGVTTRELTRLHSECGLIDAALDRHGITGFTTYQRCNQVIDYVLVEPNIQQCVKSVGYEPFNMHIFSDHRGIFIDISTSECFGSSLLPLQPMQLWDLATKRSHQIAPYFEYKEQNLSQHNWFHKIRQLKQGMQTNTPDHAFAEDVYCRLVSSSVHVGSKLKRFPLAPYSPTIARLRNIQRLLKLAVTQHKTSRDMEVNITQAKAKLGNAGYQLPETQELCTLALARTTRPLKAALWEELASNISGHNTKTI